MKTSRGLSEVVMTVLLVFLTIVLVGVVAVGVVRFSQDRFGNFNLCSKIDVRIEERGYTCYDSVENILALQIVKNGEGVVSELNFILGFVDGNSESLIKKEEIAQNVERTFYFNLTNLSSAVKNVAVGAVSGGEDCGLGNFVNVPSCSLGDVDEDLVEEVVEVGGVWEVLDEG